MEKTKVDTRLIKSIGYDKEKKIMEVEFTSDMIHIYNKLPEKVYEELMNSRNIDKYFKEKIVNKYHYNRLK